jgi:hypothetical protein
VTHQIDLFGAAGITTPSSQRWRYNGGSVRRYQELFASLAATVGCSADPVAAGALPNGTPVIISGGEDGAVRVWRTADGTPVVAPLDLPESVRAIAVHGNVIIAVAGADIAVHKLALPREHAVAAVSVPEERPADETTG